MRAFVHFTNRQLLFFAAWICLFLTIGALTFLLLAPKKKFNPIETVPSIELLKPPKNPFVQPNDWVKKIGSGPLSLKTISLKPLLPNLKNTLSFLGQNERPDIEKLSYHLQFDGSKEIKSICPGEKIYLIYEKNSSEDCLQSSPGLATPQPECGDLRVQGFYQFSPNNAPTSLWLEIQGQTDNSFIRASVFMKDSSGELISEPAENQQFRIQRSEISRHIPLSDIGGFRVDSTLLVRQKAKWIGKDLFLKEHGGDQFAEVQDKERIEFCDSEGTAYHCFVQNGDYLIWKQGKWQTPHEKTTFYPLLIIKKIDERVLTFDFWDIEGRNKLPLSLIKTKEYEPLPDLTHQFKFVGAKTWAQFIVETHGQRLILRPNEWLVYTSNEWSILSTPEEIDNFVEKKISGPLFILDRMEKIQGKQTLFGHLFNSSRTERQEVKLPAVSSTTPSWMTQTTHLPPPVRAETLYEPRGEER